MSRKPRADAKLKTLPEERQAAIIEHMRSHKLAETLAWLRADGLVTSTGALSLFWDWWHLQQQFKADAETADSLISELKRDVPALSEEQLDELGQRTFSLLSIRRQDLKGFVRIRSARSKAELEKAKLQIRQQAEHRLAEGLKLQREKFRRETAELFLKWVEDKRAREIATSTESFSDRIRKLDQLMFPEDWDSQS
jgi:hypothetical protein